EHRRDVGDGVWFPDPRPLVPLRSLLAEWFPRVAEIITLIGSHNLLATPSRRQLDDAELRPLLDEFPPGATGAAAQARAGRRGRPLAPRRVPPRGQRRRRRGARRALPPRVGLRGLGTRRAK